jgi:hypothetical protein
MLRKYGLKTAAVFLPVSEIGKQHERGSFSPPA